MLTILIKSIWEKGSIWGWKDAIEYSFITKSLPPRPRHWPLLPNDFASFLIFFILSLIYFRKFHPQIHFNLSLSISRFHILICPNYALNSEPPLILPSDSSRSFWTMSVQVQPPPPEHQYQLEKLDVFKIKGKDKQGRRILRIIGKFFPGFWFLSLFLLFVVEVALLCFDSDFLLFDSDFVL